MATVHFPAALRGATGGVAQVDVVADEFRDLRAALLARFPDLATRIDALAVAIDGVMIAEPFAEPLAADSDVHFLPRLAAG